MHSLQRTPSFHSSLVVQFFNMKNPAGQITGSQERDLWGQLVIFQLVLDWDWSHTFWTGVTLYSSDEIKGQFQQQTCSIYLKTEHEWLKVFHSRQHFLSEAETKSGNGEASNRRRKKWGRNSRRALVKHLQHSSPGVGS